MYMDTCERCSFLWEHMGPAARLIHMSVTHQPLAVTYMYPPTTCGVQSNRYNGLHNVLDGRWDTQSTTNSSV